MCLVREVVLPPFVYAIGEVGEMSPKGAIKTKEKREKGFKRQKPPSSQGTNNSKRSNHILIVFPFLRASFLLCRPLDCLLYLLCSSRPSWSSLPLSSRRPSWNRHDLLGLERRFDYLYGLQKASTHVRVHINNRKTKTSKPPGFLPPRPDLKNAESIPRVM